METKDTDFIKCYGSTTVGSRGQVVIPINARKELGISPGGTLLVFHPPHGQGLFLLKADAIETMLNTMSEGLARFEKLLGDYLPDEKTREKKE
jgi:AbrB family looped-hinge helix DNA binding protein